MKIMSLCFLINSKDSNFLLMTCDGRALKKVNGKDEIASNSKSKLYSLSSNVVLFTSGMLETNERTVETIKKKISSLQSKTMNSLIKLISDTCREQWHICWQEDPEYMAKWQRASDHDWIGFKPISIPISIVMAFYAPNTKQKGTIIFAPENNFEPVILDSEIVVKGAECERAYDLLMNEYISADKIKDFPSLVKAIQQVYESVSQETISVGGECTYLVIGDWGIEKIDLQKIFCQLQ